MGVWSSSFSVSASCWPLSIILLISCSVGSSCGFSSVGVISIFCWSFLLVRPATGETFVLVIGCSSTFIGESESKTLSSFRTSLSSCVSNAVSTFLPSEFPKLFCSLFEFLWILALVWIKPGRMESGGIVICLRDWKGDSKLGVCDDGMTSGDITSSSLSTSSLSVCSVSSRRFPSSFWEDSTNSTISHSIPSTSLSAPSLILSSISTPFSLESSPLSIFLPTLFSVVALSMASALFSFSLSLFPVPRTFEPTWSSSSFWQTNCFLLPGDWGFSSSTKGKRENTLNNFSFDCSLTLLVAPCYRN